MKRNRAFTLIELLVVIAIIAILAAILFPVFAQAKLAAKKAGAISATKQLATATMLYMGDYDDMFPMGCGACWWYPTDGGWSLDTQPYVKNLELLRDPTDPKSKKGWMAWLKTNSNGIPISFASNGYVNWDGAANSLFGVMGLVQNVAPASNRCGATAWMGNTIRNHTEVTDQAGTIMFAERFDSQLTWGMGDMIVGVNWWDNTGHPGLLPDATRDGTPYTATNDDGVTYTANKDNRNGAVTNPYSDKSVFAMSDGHAKVFAAPQTNPDPVNKPAQNMWNALR